MTQGKYDEAEQLLREALQLAQRLQERDPAAYADWTIGLARALMYKVLNGFSSQLVLIMITLIQRKFPEAEELMRRALRIYKSVHGKLHSTYAHGLNNLFCLYERQVTRSLLLELQVLPRAR